MNDETSVTVQSYVTETLPIIVLTDGHNGVKFRCAARNAALLPNEALPSTEVKLNVLCKLYVGIILKCR